MRLRTLELQNYRKYRGHHEVLFGQGILGLLGPNGVGKSTLIEALAWAFYGADPIRYKGGVEGLRTSGVPDSDPVSVSVEFELANEHYRVVRTLKGKNLTPEASLSRGDRLLASGAKEVAAAVAKRLGLDWRSFYTTLFTRQKELDAFSSMGAAERKAMVERLLGIDILDKVRKEVSRAATTYSTRLEEKRAQTRDEGGQSKDEKLKNRLEELQERLARLAEERADLQAAVERAKANLAEADKRWQTAQKEKDHHNDLQQQLQKVKAEVISAAEAMENAEKQLAELAAKETELERLEPKLVELEPAKAKVDKLKKARRQVERRQGLQSDVERLSRQTETKTKALKTLEEELAAKPDPAPQLTRLEKAKAEEEATAATIQQELADMRSWRKALKDRTTSNRLHLAEIERLGAKGNCPKCERPLEEHQPKLVAKYRQELMEDEAKNKELAALEAKLNAKMKAKREQLQALAENERKYLAMKEERASLKAKIEAGQAGLIDLNDRLKTHEAEITSLAEVVYDEATYKAVQATIEKLLGVRERVGMLQQEVVRKPEREAEAERQKQRHATAKAEVETLNAQLEELAFDPTTHAIAQAAHKQANEDYSQAREDSRSKDADIARTEEKITTTRRDLENQQKLQKEIDHLEEKAAYHGRLEQLFKAFREHLVGRVAPTLAAYTSELLGPLTEGRYTQVQIKPDTYEILVYDDGPEAYPLNRFSGGETDLVNLALRLAISRLLAERSGSDLNLVILDEIFGSQDEQRRVAIMRGLQNLKNRFGQILLITHIDQVKDLVESALRVEETVDGGARVVEG